MTVVDEAYKIKHKTDARILPMEEDVGEARSVDGLRVSEEEYWQRYYHDPDLRGRLTDRVYNTFILLDYQVAERHAKEAEQRAEAERQRAEAADHRADRLAAMLRTLGIDSEKDQ